jgi:hypothetical protein
VRRGEGRESTRAAWSARQERGSGAGRAEVFLSAKGKSPSSTAWIFSCRPSNLVALAEARLARVPRPPCQVYLHCRFQHVRETLTRPC